MRFISSVTEKEERSMKKLSLGLVVCALASVAYGVPAFVVNGGEPIQLTPGVPLVVDVTIVDGTGGMGGMTLNVEATPFTMVDEDPFTAQGAVVVEDLDIIGTGTIFNASNTGQSLESYHNGGAPNVVAQASLTTASGVLNNATGVAGKVTLVAKLGTEGQTGLVSTDSTIFGGGSDMFTALGDPLGFAQGSAPFVVIPEPVTGLLLLAGLPLLRRRRA
jgi:MYXO-CTERM domain-containing protein